MSLGLSPLGTTPVGLPPEVSTASGTDGVGVAQGSSVVTGVGSSEFSSVGNTSGVGTASGVGGSIVSAVGNASGTSSVSGVGNYTAGSSTVGIAVGTSTVTGVGASVVSAVGSSAGYSVVTGYSTVPVVEETVTKGGDSDDAPRKRRYRVGNKVVEVTPEELRKVIQQEVLIQKAVAKTKNKEVKPAVVTKAVQKALEPVVASVPIPDVLPVIQELKQRLETVKDVPVLKAVKKVEKQLIQEQQEEDDEEVLYLLLMG